MTEVFHDGDPTPEENPYDELDRWLQWTQPGEPKFLALSDTIARLEVEVDSMSDDPEVRAQANTREVIIQEKMRDNEDNPKAWGDNSTYGSAYLTAFADLNQRRMALQVREQSVLEHYSGRKDKNPKKSIRAVAEKLYERKKQIIETGTFVPRQ